MHVEVFQAALPNLFALQGVIIDVTKPVVIKDALSVKVIKPAEKATKKKEWLSNLCDI